MEPVEDEHYEASEESYVAEAEEELVVDEHYEASEVSEDAYGYDNQAKYDMHELHAKIEAMAAAQLQTKADHDAILVSSKEKFYSDIEQLQAEYKTDTIDVKEANFNAHVATLRESWLSTVTTRTEAVNQAINTAETAFAQAADIKREELEKRSKEIQWAISAIYHYQVQHNLQEALDEAVANLSAICDEKEADFASKITWAKETWAYSVEAATDELDAHIDIKDQECDTAQSLQIAILSAHVEAATERFEEWASNEADLMDASITECDEAWHSILKSYCLDPENESPHYGHGCGYGRGADAHYDESVPIEEHDAVLSYGQGQDIKEIDNIPERVQRAVDLTQEGVADHVIVVQTG